MIVDEWLEDGRRVSVCHLLGGRARITEGPDALTVDRLW